MTGKTLPGIGLTGDWASGEDGWDAGMNDNLITLSTLTSLTVASRATQLNEFSTDGIVTIVPSGELANKIAVRFNGSWRYISPKTGTLAYVTDEKTHVFYNGSGWHIDGTDVDVLKFMLPDGDMGAALSRAAAFARQHGKHSLLCGPGRFQWRTSANLTFDGTDDPLNKATLHLIGAGEKATLFEVDLTEAFPALDCVGNTRMVLRDFTMIHASTCLSTASIFCAKPGGYPLAVGREPTIERVTIDRPRTSRSPGFLIMGCDLASVRSCEVFARRPLLWGSYVPPDVSLVGEVYPAGTLSKFQSVDPAPDYTAMYLYDSFLWGTDYCVDNWGSTGSRMCIYGGYNTLFGGAPDVIDGARGHIHMRRLGGGGEGGTIRTWGTRFELGTDTGPVNGIVIATGSLSYPVFYADPDVNIPVFYVPSGSIVASPEVRIFSAYSSPPIFAGAGAVQVPNVIGNRSISAVETTVIEPTLIGAYGNNVLGAPSGERLTGDVFRPGLTVGSTGAGFLTWDNLRKYGPLLTMRVGYRGFDFGSTDEVVGENQTISPSSPTEYTTPGTPGYYAGGEGYGAAGGDVYLSGGWSDLGPSGYGSVWLTSGYGNKKIAKWITGSGNWPDYFIFTAGSNETAGRSRIGTSGNNLLFEPFTRITQVGGTLSVGTGTENRAIELNGSNGGDPSISSTGGNIVVKPNNVTALALNAVSTAVNYLEIRAGNTGAGAGLFSAGADSNSGLGLFTKGGGYTFFYSHGGGAVQLAVVGVPSSNRYVTIGGSNGGNPYIGTSAGNLQLLPATNVTEQRWTAAPTGFSSTKLRLATTGVYYGGQIEGYLDQGLTTGLRLVTLDGGSEVEQVRIINVSGADRYITLRGSAGGSPRIDVSAGSLQVGSSAILGASGSTIGFYGTTPVAKPNVTGSWAGNPAGQSLAAALATLGLITNLTTP